MVATQIILLALIIVSGVICLFTIRKKPTLLNRLSYPFTTFLILILALLNTAGACSLYKCFVIGGLAFALLADIFTFAKENSFRFRALFLIFAMLIFMIAFASDPGPYIGWIYFIPSSIYLIIFGLLFFRKAGKLSTIVVIYVILMMMLLSQISGRTWYLAEEGVGMAFIGVVLFVSGEAVNIYNRFVKSPKSKSIVFLALYWLALLSISFSI